MLVAPRDDREPFVKPSGETIWIKYTFVHRRRARPLGIWGSIFSPREGNVLWADGKRDGCLLFGGTEKVLASLRDDSAILPAGPERTKAYREYLGALKFLWRELVGRVVSVEGNDGPTQRDIWVLGLEEIYDSEFEMAASRAREAARRPYWRRFRPGPAA